MARVRTFDFAVIEDVLDVVDQPVWLVAGNQIVCCNSAASVSGREIADAVRRATDAGFDDPRFARICVTIDTVAFSFVVARGSAPAALPPSLERVASRVARGMTDKDIARALGIPLSTVRTYVQRIYGKLGVRSRVELSRRWSRRT